MKCIPMLFTGPVMLGSVEGTLLGPVISTPIYVLSHIIYQECFFPCGCHTFLQESWFHPLSFRLTSHRILDLVLVSYFMSYYVSTV